jgi:dienelactone hydrolase
MRSRTQRLLTRVSNASRPLRNILRFLLAMLWISAGAAQSQELTREIYTPSKEKGPAIVVVSGVSGTAAYREYSSKLAETGYYVVLIDGKDVLILPSDTRGQEGAANLRKVIMEAQSAEKALSGKVALVGFSLGGGGVLLHGAPLKDHVAAVVAYYPAITRMGPNMQPLA